jgi:serine/threonine protein kinase
MDFGIAKVLNDAESPGQHATKTGDTLGSPLYMSPEASQGRKADTRSDLYSLGCVLYEAMTGTPPFTGSSALDTMLRHLNDAAIPPSQVVGKDKVDSRLEQVVLKLLQKNPANRFQSMADLNDVLAGISFGQQPAAAPKATKQKAQFKFTSSRHNRLKPMAIAGIALAIAIISGSTVLFALHNSKEKPSAAAPVQSMGPKRNSKTHMLADNPLDSFNLVAEEADRLIDKQTPVKTLTEAIKNPMNHLYSNNRSHLSLRQVIDSLERFSVQDLAPFLTKDAMRITDLDMHDCLLGDDALKYFKNMKLRELNISGNPMRDVSDIKYLTTLQTLSASKTPLTAAGLKSIATLPELTSLSLDGCTFDDGDLQALAKSPKLHFLNIMRCKNVTTKGVLALQKKRKDIDVKYTSEVK